MEEAAFDPELSRDLIKLLNSKVKDLSKALEDAKTVRRDDSSGMACSC